MTRAVYRVAVHAIVMRHYVRITIECLLSTQSGCL